MKYIILLRGINISGKNKISMSELKIELEKVYQNVITYLNSGNIILESSEKKEEIIIKIKSILKNKFHLEIPIYIIEYEKLKELINHQPSWWDTKDKNIYDNVIFILQPLTTKEVIEQIGEPSKDIDKIEPYEEIIFWSYHLKYYQKSNWWKKTATLSIKDNLTIRTANTIKKVLEYCEK